VGGTGMREEDYKNMRKMERERERRRAYEKLY
jgi:hypothetical protein